MYILYNIGCTPPPLAIGDIHLIPYTEDPNLKGFYEPMIYYTDGQNKAGFGGTCADDSYQQEGIVMCRQLGYAFDEFQYRYSCRLSKVQGEIYSYMTLLCWKEYLLCSNRNPTIYICSAHTAHE